MSGIPKWTRSPNLQNGDGRTQMGNGLSGVFLADSQVSPQKLLNIHAIYYIDPNNSRITTEFGDFHIPLTGCHIIVEIDGSGIDLTNLIKHWYTLYTHFNDSPVDGKPITLLCVYTQKKGNDLHSREIYWDLLYQQIRQHSQYAEKLDAKRFPVRIESSEQDKEREIQTFLDEFVARLCAVVAM